VLATGTSYTVRDFVTVAFDHAGLDWEKYVKFDERYQRPAEVDSLIGDASKAESLLGWKPQTYMHDLARLMVDADCRAAAAQARSAERDYPAIRLDGRAATALRSRLRRERHARWEEENALGAS
jgi:GDPmannose 4,6-dehydratase